MAGGAGERFWPLSRQKRPKQLLKLTGSGLTMLEESVKRIEPLVGIENIFISTSELLKEPIAKSSAGIKEDNILAEPMKRNTAGALVWATACLMARYQDEDLSMAILTADQLIEPEEGFRDTVETALRTAEEDGGLGTIGITPDRPDTGYGYIELGEPHRMAGVSNVVRFTEKPNTETAQEFVNSGRYLWNSGMFFWTLQSFIEELHNASPMHAAVLEDIVIALTEGDEQGAKHDFGRLPDLSIDYALMEKSNNVFVARADFTWDDLGTWSSLERTGNPEPNKTTGDTLLIDSNGCIAYNETAKKLCMLGMEDTVVVVTEDAVLVCHKDKAQDVKQVLAKLKEDGDSLL